MLRSNLLALLLLTSSTAFAQVPQPAPPVQTAPVVAAPPPVVAPSKEYGRLDFGWYLGTTLLYGRSTDPKFKLVGLGFDMGVDLQIGILPKFPGVEGGHWHAVDVGVTGSLHHAGTFYDEGFGVQFIVGGAASVGYEYLYMRPLKQGQERQRGIGGAFAFRTGLQWSVIGDSDLNFYAGIDPTLGLTLSLIIPKYHVAKAHLHRTMVNLDWWRLPGTEVSFLTLGAGVAF